MKLVTLFFLLFSYPLAAQDYQKEINEQVWEPFIDSFNRYNTDNFLALHSRNLVRSPRDAKDILNWEQYFNNQKQGDERSKQNGYKRTLELRFTERIANADRAIDVGYYKTTSINDKGESSAFIGKFLVVLQKEKGVWKILVDTDSSEGNTVTEKHFLEAKPLE
jgi:ketosteroid isomerase-like protein